MKDVMEFACREEFREWLYGNCLSNTGVWLRFGKAVGPETTKANEAFEEALCFGWIDGQIKTIDDKSYIKYFSLRRENSKWSVRNKTLAEKLDRQGKMTDTGIRKIEEAKRNGQWSNQKSREITREQIAFLVPLLEEYEVAYTNFMGMPSSVQKTYTRAYLDAKTDTGRTKRLGLLNGSTGI